MSQNNSLQQQHEAVNHPKHYNSDASGIECIEIAELLPFCLGNCIKYVFRAGLKGNKQQDYQKAAWYAKRAYCNAETLTPQAINRLRIVIKHQADGEKQAVLSTLIDGDLYAVYAMLNKLA